MKLRYFAIGVAALVLVGQCSNATGDESDPHEPSPAATATVTHEPTPSEAPSSTSTLTPTPTPTPSTPTTEPEPEETGDQVGTALVALAALAVKGRAPMTGYDRDRYGPAWLDADRNGCDTRNDLLAMTLSAVVLEGNGCVVATGTYDDPYTGRTIAYRQGDGNLLDVDHVVAMGNAWATGAQKWGIRKRAAFANDPLNLLPADSGANRQKGDGDAATWLPPHKAFRCDYVSRQVVVKGKYGLWVTPPEKAAIQRVLSDCPGQSLVEDVWQMPTAVDHNITDPGAPKPAATPSSVPLVGSTPIHFQNCDAARAAGAAPVLRGDPGYGDHLDRDGDGVACE